jgi:hypothetical protein
VLCRDYDIPFFAIFAVKNAETGTEYKQEGLFPAVKEISLTDDKIRECSHIMHNYSTVNEINLPDQDMDFPTELN